MHTDTVSCRSRCRAGADEMAKKAVAWHGGVKSSRESAATTTRIVKLYYRVMMYSYFVVDWNLGKKGG